MMVGICSCAMESGSARENRGNEERWSLQRGPVVSGRGAGDGSSPRCVSVE